MSRTPDPHSRHAAERAAAGPLDGEVDPLAGKRLDRLRRRLDRMALDVADVAEEADEAGLTKTADALVRAARLLFLVIGPPDRPAFLLRRSVAVKDESDGSRTLNCPGCDHQIESVPGVAEYECPQCGCPFYDEKLDEEVT